MNEQTILLLAFGAVLVLGALLAGTVGRAASAPVARVLRIVAGLAGVVLIGWSLVPVWQSYRTAPAPAAASTPAAPTPAAPPTSAENPALPVASAPHPGPETSPIELVQRASTALNDCQAPTAPQLPDGAQATLPQMNQARQAFQTYDAATNTYTRCVDEAVDHVAKQYGAGASVEGMKDLKAFGVRAHNAAIDQEQSVAEQLNTQVRTYNAKHPHK